jgi:hypothetical protein
MGNAGIFDDLLEDFTAICYSLWLFGIVCGYLVYLSRLGIFVQRKIWQPWHRSRALDPSP